MKKLLLITLILLQALSATKAQETENTAKVFYRFGSTQLRGTYMDNDAQLQQLTRSLTNTDIDWSRYRITITSSSSPEGRENINRRMSEQRAQSLADYLVEKGLASREHIIINSHRVDWSELRTLLKESSLNSEATPYVEYLDSVISRTNAGEDIKDHEVVDGLRKVYNGWKFPYIRRYLFPLLRYAKATLEPIDGTTVPLRPKEEVVLPPVTIPEAVTIPETVLPDTVAPVPTAPTVHTDSVAVSPTLPTVPTDSVTVSPTVPTDSVAVSPTLPTAPAVQPTAPTQTVIAPFALKTNLLYDAILIPNIGVEWGFADHWSAAANWMYTWLSNDAKHRYWRIYGGDLELRYWLGSDETRPLKGHHFGAYGGMLTYDIEFGGKGYQAHKWSYHFGLSYGYSMPIARRLNLDFNIGIGYLGGEYYEYEPYYDGYHWLATKQRRWFGPTKAEVSLVWLLFNKKKK